MKSLAAFILALSIPAMALAATDAGPVDSSPAHVAELIQKLDGEGMSQQVAAKGAYEELMRIGRPAIPQLLEAAQDKSPWVRLWSGAALAATHDAQAVEPLLRLMEDPFPTARAIAVWHGAGLHDLDPRIAPRVVQRLADSAGEVRKWAERALRERVKLRGVTGDLEALLASDSPSGRMLAFKLLMSVREQEPLAAITRALAAERDWKRRSAAVRCLGEGVAPVDEAMVDLLFRAMDDESDEVKADAVEVMEFALKEQGEKLANKKGVTDRLGERLAPLLDAKLPRLRGTALYLLCAGQGPKRYDRALEAVDDPDPLVRGYAFRALGRCGMKTRQVIEQSVAHLDDADGPVRRAAFAALRWATAAKFDYNPDDPPTKRAEAIRAIQAEISRAGGQ